MSKTPTTRQEITPFFRLALIQEIYQLIMKETETLTKSKGSRGSDPIGSDFAYWAGAVSDIHKDSTFQYVLNGQGQPVSDFVKILQANLSDDHAAFLFISECY